MLREAEQDAQQTVTIFRQHALNVFETHELIAARINEHLRGMTWDEIAGGEPLHHYLNKIQEDYPQVQGIWLADPAGIIRNSSRFFPTPPADVSDRDYFLALQRADHGTFIGHPVYIVHVSSRTACKNAQLWRSQHIPARFDFTR